MPDWLYTALPFLAQGLGLGVAVWFVREVFRRKFERQIAKRYLYGGKRDRMMLVAAGGSALIAVAGALFLLLSHGASPYGVLALLVGMISAAVFGLLSMFTVFTSVSVLGVALGVAALTIVLAVTTGFQEQFRDKVLGVNAHVIVMKSQSTFAEYRDVMKTAKAIDPDVIAVQPFNFNEMLVTRGKGELSGVAIKGVDPKLVNGVLDLAPHMVEGSVDSLGKEPGDPASCRRSSWARSSLTSSRRSWATTSRSSSRCRTSTGTRGAPTRARRAPASSRSPASSTAASTSTTAASCTRRSTTARSSTAAATR